MSKLARMFFLVATLAAALPAFSAPRFLYFAPAVTTSPDGKFALAAFGEGQGDAMRVSFRYVTVDPASGRIEVRSDVVFGDTYLAAPDIRGYGPDSTAWSFADRAQVVDGQFPRKVGDLAVVRWQSRKTARIAVLRLKKVNGKEWLVRVPYDQEAYEKAARAELDRKIKAAGFDPEKESIWNFQDLSFVDEKTLEADSFIDFELESGRAVCITSEFYLTRGEGADQKTADASYRLCLKFSLDAAGAPKVEQFKLVTEVVPH